MTINNTTFTYSNCIKQIEQSVDIPNKLTEFFKILLPQLKESLGTDQLLQRITYLYQLSQYNHTTIMKLIWNGSATYSYPMEWLSCIKTIPRNLIVETVNNYPYITGSELFSIDTNYAIFIMYLAISWDTNIDTAILTLHRIQYLPTQQWYLEYLISKHWIETREKFLELRKHQCEICHRTEKIYVHHKHYNTLWHEKPDDLQALCRKCHYSIHNKE